VARSSLACAAAAPAQTTSISSVSATMAPNELRAERSGIAE